MYAPTSSESPFESHAHNGWGDYPHRSGSGAPGDLRSQLPPNPPGFRDDLITDRPRRSEAADLDGEADTRTSFSSQSSRKRRRIDDSRTAVTYPRKRATAACRLCRARKVKCNNARPSCGSCMASKAQCVYEDTQDYSAFDTASILILDRLNQVLSRLDKLPQVSDVEPLRPATTPGAEAPEQQVPPRSTHMQGTYDELRIPSAQTTPDAVLQWPVFASCHPPNYLIDAIFEAEIEDDDLDSEDVCERPWRLHRTKQKGGGIIDEDVVPQLIRRFLEFVHTKNPIVDIDTLWDYAHRVAEDGLKWDSASCLVLLACALGCVARPYAERPTLSSSLASDEDALQHGEAYYNLARRRFGLLKTGILAPQCHFLAGVYLMYTMRPLLAWSEFHSASKTYFLYLHCRARQISASSNTVQGARRRRLEQRLYWSCYKSECEVRAEMDLPDSSLADLHYPDMHPSPPDIDAASPTPMVESLIGEGLVQSPSGTKLIVSYQQQEQSWFYYLTEITLRRIGNRLLNTLYSVSHVSWTNDMMPFMVNAAEEFEHQLQEWHDRLPTQIRFEDEHTPAEELPTMVRGRALQIKTWLYRPFLYYVIHNPADAPYRSLVQPLADKALFYSLIYLKGEPSRHRHHGTWFGIRDCVSQILCIIGAARSGTCSVPQDWRTSVGDCIDRMRYWEKEVPEVTRMIQVLESYL